MLNTQVSNAFDPLPLESVVGTRRSFIPHRYRYSLVAQMAFTNHDHRINNILSR
uniref:Uncharacterized protein n=1 Tax=Arundo donax TaxID=35708 RepID=A0A0A9FXZ1_ARUDO